MVRYNTIGSRVFDVCNILIMLLLVFICAYPLVFIIFASMSDPTWVMQQNSLIWYPYGLTSVAYQRVFEYTAIWKGYQMTLFYTISGTAVNIFLTSLGAYALSRKGFMLRKALTFFVVFTMWFSGGLIPTYLTVQSLGLDNTVLALILPGAINTYNLIVMRTSFNGIPDSLEDSAKVDGANEFHILFKIVLPLSLPVIMVMVLFYGIGHWNAWFDAYIYLRTSTLYPLQLILRHILLQNSYGDMMQGAGTGASASDFVPISVTIKYAVIVVATLPIMLLYPFLQKYFVKGVMIGAIKG